MKVNHAHAASFATASAGPPRLPQAASALDNVASLREQREVPLQIRVLLIGQQRLHLAGEDGRFDKDHDRTIHH
jgi:hypothetical protein